MQGRLSLREKVRARANRRGFRHSSFHMQRVLPSPRAPTVGWSLPEGEGTARDARRSIFQSPVINPKSETYFRFRHAETERPISPAASKASVEGSGTAPPGTETERLSMKA